MHDVVIVGGGLAGLALADHLERAGIDWMLVEARSRFGGRIKCLHDGGAAFDLGPSWFWPGQPRMAALTQRLGLHVFDQHAEGELIYEDESGGVQRGLGYASMEGSHRIQGGMMAIIDGLIARLPQQRLSLASPVKSVRQHKGISLEDGRQIIAKHVILAIPPRVAADLTFDPVLSETQTNALRNTPTWMGGQAKFVATYDTPFWRNSGLSGDAMSRHGPMVEIHDASSLDGPAALFGFVGIPAKTRDGQQDALVAAAIAQLGRLFGQDALAPRETALADWAFAKRSASILDHQPLRAHPPYGPHPDLVGLWDGKLHFASTEAASQFGGYLEGALEIAEHTAKALT